MTIAEAHLEIECKRTFLKLSVFLMMTLQKQARAMAELPPASMEVTRAGLAPLHLGAALVSGGPPKSNYTGSDFGDSEIGDTTS